MNRPRASASASSSPASARPDSAAASVRCFAVTTEVSSSTSTTSGAPSAEYLAPDVVGEQEAPASTRGRETGCAAGRARRQGGELQARRPAAGPVDRRADLLVRRSGARQASISAASSGENRSSAKCTSTSCPRARSRSTGSLGVRRDSSTTCSHSGRACKNAASDVDQPSSSSTRWMLSRTSTAVAGWSPSSRATIPGTTSGRWPAAGRRPPPSEVRHQLAQRRCHGRPELATVPVGLVHRQPRRRHRGEEHQSTSNDVLPDPAGARPP